MKDHDNWPQVALTNGAPAASCDASVKMEKGGKAKPA